MVHIIFITHRSKRCHRSPVFQYWNFKASTTSPVGPYPPEHVQKYNPLTRKKPPLPLPWNHNWTLFFHQASHNFVLGYPQPQEHDQDGVKHQSLIFAPVIHKIACLNSVPCSSWPVSFQACEHFDDPLVLESYRTFSGNSCMRISVAQRD